jgi:hypothetical protein
MPEPGPTTPRKRTPTRVFRDFLRRQGFRPWLEDDAPTSVWFRFEGLRYKAQLDDRDQDFVQIALGFTLREESRDELTLLRAMNELQASTKVVKVYVSPAVDFVEFEMELLLDGRPPTLPLLERCLETLRCASREYFAKVRPEKPAAQA